MARQKKLLPQVELRATGRILIRNNRKTHYKFIEPRRPQGTQRFDIRGKSSKYLAKTVIPYYITKIATERRKTKMYQELLVRLQDKCNAIIKDIRTTERKSLRALIKLNNKEFSNRIRLEAIKIANKNFNYTKFKVAKSYHAAAAYPVILKYARLHKIGPKQMGVLILLHIHGQMRSKELVKHGYDNFAENQSYLKGMLDMGFVERFPDPIIIHGKSFIYMPSVKGKKVVASFNNFYGKHVKNIIESDEYKQKQLRWANI